MELKAYRRVLHGISGVHATAYDSAGEIDAALTARIVDGIAAAGIHNIVTGGNTGEFYSLTVDEVIRLQSIAIEANAGRSAITAAAGRSLRDAIAIARAAKAAGADGVMVHHPLDPFAAPHGQVDYFIGVAEAMWAVLNKPCGPLQRQVQPTSSVSLIFRCKMGAGFVLIRSQRLLMLRQSAVRWPW